MIGAGSPGRSVSTRGRAPAGAVYVLFMLAPFTGGLTALIGWLVGKASKGGADGAALDHLRRQGWLFWTALLWAIPIAILGFIGWLTRIVLVGYPIGWLAGAAAFILSAWFVLSSLFGLLRLQSDRSPRG